MPSSGIKRDPKGRFAPGTRGKTKGCRHRATRLLESLFQDNAEFVGEMALKMLARGEPVALRELLTRLAPPPRGRVVQLEHFPKINSISDVPGALADLANRVATGEISAEEAAAVAGVLDKYNAAAAVAEQQRQIAEMKAEFEALNAIIAETKQNTSRN